MDTALKKTLKAKAHHLSPVILLGTKGLTPAVISETNIALNAHELIKISIKGMEKKDRIIVANTLCNDLEAELIQTLGNTAVIYRKNKDK